MNVNVHGTTHTIRLNTVIKRAITLVLYCILNLKINKICDFQPLNCLYKIFNICVSVCQVKTCKCISLYLAEGPE
jgi:hypothetical protein